jgi:hypothetical protein
MLNVTAVPHFFLLSTDLCSGLDQEYHLYDVRWLHAVACEAYHYPSVTNEVGRSHKGILMRQCN